MPFAARAVLILFAVGLLLPSPARAQEASPSEQVLRLVPPDMAFGVLVQDLRANWQRLQQVPWFASLKLETEIAKNPELARVATFVHEMLARVQVTLPQLRDEILGDAVVLAYRPGSASQPEEECGLVVLRARDADLLARLVDRINQEQKNEGGLKALIEAEYKGMKYVRRVERGTTHFYALHGPLFIATNREELLQQVLDARAAGHKSDLVERWRRARADQGLVAAWVNPRALDREIERDAQSKTGAEAGALRHFLNYWRALDAVWLTVRPHDNFELALTVQGRPENLPDAAQRFLKAAAQPSDLWQRFPAPAALTIASRVDFAALAQTLTEFAPPEARKGFLDALRKGLRAALELPLDDEGIAKLLAHLGPDWGLCLAAAPNPGDFPHVLAALAVQPGPAEHPVDQACLKALQFLAKLAVFQHNLTSEPPLRLQTVRQDSVEVHYLEGANLPSGLRPAFALKDGYLVVASSPQAIARFQKSPRNVSGDEVPCLRISVVEFQKLVKHHRDGIARLAAEKNQIPAELIRLWLDALLDPSPNFDLITISHRPEARQSTWILRLSPR